MLKSMFFTAFVVFAVAVVAISGSSLPILSQNSDNGNSWNELLNTDIFDDSLNSINIHVKSDSNPAVGVLDQLEQVLSQEDVLKSIYLKYRNNFREINYAAHPRPEYFKEQLLKIAAHNLEANLGSHGWWMGVNQFTDMTPAELRRMRGGAKVKLVNRTSSYVPTTSSLVVAATSPSLDYVSQNRVNNVKNQGDCDASAMFAAVSVTESAMSIQGRYPHTSVIPNLSVQEVLDCAVDGFNCGAGGPSPTAEDALKYLFDKAVSEWADYPLSEPVTVGECKKDVARATGLNNYTLYSDNSEERLKQLLVNSGPVVAVIYASDSLHQTYTKGVYPGSECGGDKAGNQVVALVGYGTEEGKDYWLIKNSWGHNWGVQGYLRLARGSNVCGILSTVYTVVPWG